MKTIRQEFRVEFRYDVHFTQRVFDIANRLLADTLVKAEDPLPRKALVVLDDGLLEHFPRLPATVEAYFAAYDSITLAGKHVVVPGGEEAKIRPGLVERIHQAVSDAGLDRHSYLLAIGGGSVIDLAGYAAATAHRGIRLIRIPTTVLSQNDSAVGVKNGINAFQTKNFLGTFAPPYAVINDTTFLTTLSDRDWRAGISEAVKVALLKDPRFFVELEAEADRLAPPVRDLDAMIRLIYRCAEMHLEHIRSAGDPFESGSSRPLDFGHWAAHQLEKLTDYRLRHGEAVAVGIALDSTYSYLSGMLDEASWRRITSLLLRLGFQLHVPELEADGSRDDDIFHGLEAFREHLGGELTIMLLEGIGKGVEVHEVHLERYRDAVSTLRDIAEIEQSAIH